MQCKKPVNTENTTEKCVVPVCKTSLKLNRVDEVEMTRFENPFAKNQLLLIFPRNKEQVTALRALGEELAVDFWSSVAVGRPLQVRLTPRQAPALEELMQRLDITSTVLAADLELLMGDQRMVKAGDSADRVKEKLHRSFDEGEDSQLGGGGIMTWTDYHSLETIDAYMEYLTRAFPDWVSTEVIGNSFECRSMRVLKVCRGGCGGKPAVWLDGGIHAREWISPAVATYIMMELVEHDSEHPRLTREMDWYILPVANPDGYVFTGCDGKMSVNCPSRFWRKTRSCNPEGRTLLGSIGLTEEDVDVCRGADANRNWDIHWSTRQSSSNYSCHRESYRGSQPFSEVETRNIRDFLLKHKNDIKIYDSLHSAGSQILMPYGFSKCGLDGCINKPDNFEALLEMAKLGNAALKTVGGEEYDLLSCLACSLNDDGFSGVSVDWAHAVAKIPFSFTLELPPKHGLDGYMKFHLRKDKIIPTGKEVWAFHQAVVEKIING